MGTPTTGLTGLTEQNLLEKKEAKEEVKETTTSFTRPSSRRFLVYLSGATHDLSPEKTGTGNVDYQNTLAQHLKERFSETFRLIEKMNDEKEIFDLIEQTKATHHPLLHIIINAPNTGCLFTIDRLKAFKERGGRLVITVLDHDKQNDSSLKKQTNDYIELADHCILLDSSNKRSVLERVTEQHGVIYEKVFTKNISTDLLPLARLNRKKWQAFQRIKNAVYTSRSDRSFIDHNASKLELLDNYKKLIQKIKQEIDKDKEHTLKFKEMMKKKGKSEEEIKGMTEEEIQKELTHREFSLNELFSMNFRTLMTSLKNVDKDLSPAMKEILSSKDKPPDQVLHILEKKLLRCLVRENIIRFKHKTPHLESIAKQGVLTSVDERFRKALEATKKEIAKDQKLTEEQLKEAAQSRIKARTPQNQGFSDILYFTCGSINPRSPNYLNGSGGEIVGDMESIAENNPDLLRGSFISDHFSAFHIPRVEPTVSVVGHDFEITYEKTTKTLKFNKGTDQVKETTTKYGEECFAYPQIDIALYLMLIKRLRYFGKELWETVINTILENPTNRAVMMQDIIQTIFHPGVLEFHIPRALQLDQFGVKCQSSRDLGSMHVYKENNQWTIVKLSSHQPQDVFVLVADQGFPFPFFRAENSNVSIESSFLKDFNQSYSLKIETPQCKIKQLFTRRSGLKDTFIQDTFFLCELEIDEASLEVLRKKKDLWIVSINKEETFSTDAFVNADNVSINIESRKIPALSLFLLNYCSRICRGQDKLLDLAPDIFKRLYDNTYATYHTLQQNIFENNQPNIDLIKSPCVNLLTEYRDERGVRNSLISKMFLYKHVEFINFIVRDFKELKEIILSTALACPALYDILLTCFEKNLKDFPELFLKNAPLKEHILKLLYSMHPAFIYCYRAAPKEIRETVSITDALLYKYQGNPWKNGLQDEKPYGRLIPGYADILKTRYDKGMSIKTLAEFFELALQNEKLTLSDCEELIYIAYLYLEKGFTLIADTIFSKIDFPVIKASLEKHIQEFVLIGQSESVQTLQLAVNRVNQYWNERKEKREVKSDSPTKPLPPDPLCHYKTMEIAYQKSRMAANEKVFSILVTKNSADEYSFILNRSSKRYYPFFVEPMGNLLSNGGKPSAFDKLNFDFSLGYHSKTVSWKKLGTASSTFYPTFFVGVLEELESKQLGVLAESANVVVIPFGQLEQLLNKPSTSKKTPQKNTSLSFNRFSKFMLTHVKKHFGSLENSLKDSKELNELLTSTRKAQKAFLKAVEQRNPVEIDSQLKTELVNVNWIGFHDGKSALDWILQEVNNEDFSSPNKERCVSIIKCVQQLLCHQAELDIKYFQVKKGFILPVIMTANMDNQFDFTDHYNALDDESRQYCFKTAYRNLSHQAKILHSYMNKNTRRLLAEYLLLELKGEALNSDLSHINMYSLFVKQQFPSKDVQEVADLRFAEFILFLLKNDDLDENCFEELCLMAACHLKDEPPSSKLALAIQAAIPKAEFLAIANNIIQQYRDEKKGKDEEERRGIVEDIEEAIAELSKYWGEMEAIFDTLSKLWDPEPPKRAGLRL